MALHMHLTKLLALTCVIEGIQAKTFDGRKPENLPSPAQVLDVTHKLLLNYKKNFVEPDIDSATRKWSTPPVGMKNLRGFNTMLPLAEFASANLSTIQLGRYDIPAMLMSYNTDLDAVDTHVIPVCDKDHLITDYPPQVIDWIGSRAQFMFGTALNELRKSGVRSAPLLSDITLAEWEELGNAEYMTLGDQIDTMTVSQEGSADDVDELTAMAMTEITDDMLKEVGGDEHISLYQDDYDGTKYLTDDDQVARAVNCTKILKGYWDIMDVHHSKKSEKMRQQFITAVAEESKKYWAERNDADKGASIAVNV